MGHNANPFIGVRITATCASIFGIFSCTIGIAEMFTWLALLGSLGSGVKGYSETDIDKSYGGVSGHALCLLAACGLWCGIWIAITGFCGCCIRLGQPTEKNIRVKNVFCIASALNAVITCPVQIGVYSYLLAKVQKPWIDALYSAPEWVAHLFHSLGIITGVASFIISIIIIVVASRIKPYAGEPKEWQDFDI